VDRLDREANVFIDGEVPEDVRDLKRARDAEPRALVRRQVRNVALAIEDAAFARRQQSREQVEEGRLPGAVGTDDRPHAAGRDLDRHVVDGGETGEAARQAFRLEDVTRRWGDLGGAGALTRIHGRRFARQSRCRLTQDVSRCPRLGDGRRFVERLSSSSKAGSSSRHERFPHQGADAVVPDVVEDPHDAARADQHEHDEHDADPGFPVFRQLRDVVLKLVVDRRAEIGPKNACIPPSSDIITTLPEYSTEPASGLMACWKYVHNQPAIAGKIAESTNALTRYLSTS
jgi:hypothetical protein